MSDDVVELILNDHRRFEELMRGLRNSSSDRAKLRDDLSQLLVAHGEAEEREVYPQLAKKASEDDEVEHGEEEHAEINQALLDFLKVEDLEGDDFDEKLEDLAEVLNHHINEEEQTLLNDAREELPQKERDKLGAAFLVARETLLKTNCGRIENVRLVVEKTKDRVD
ncbi:hemerythrin domain-containing protein [Amycolatopsis sp. 195334CR]|uniref:hemerythrin domain-containing protein n=1 Tax=Amycolatopsis sp. 195334CR TaxID=2814588 RepID=UPI001A90B645|nr:hemerythrin domain-containing protein [Amycolatopsis sp. 195334CR]MBN6035575.1 hemerythrin domain-containing protein [Amycolatopsis sp. 195334CR]